MSRHAALVPLLSDRDPGVRAAAATGLGTMAKRPIPSLGRRRRHPSSSRRSRTSRTPFGGRPPRCSTALPDVKLPPELAAALKDESAEVRAAAARALARFGPDLGPEIPALFAMLERDETDVRSACVEALEAAWPSPALVPTLVEFLKSRNRSGKRLCSQTFGPDRA